MKIMEASLRRDIMISLAVIGGSFVLFLIAFFGLSFRMDEQVTQIARAQTTIANQSQAATTLADLKRDAPLAQQYQTKLSLLLPKNEELLGVTRAVDAAARARNVTFHFAFQNGGAPATAAAAGTVPFTLEAEGAYENVRDFFSDLESKSSKFLMQFDSYNFEATNAGYKMNTQGKVFFRQ